MLAPVTHILPLTTIRRERRLPIPGKVVARKGQKVSATDTVAEAILSPSHLQLDVARGLGLAAEDADQHIQCQPGMQVAEGDILAGPVGLARRVIRSPRSGRVVLVGSGQVLLEVQGKPYELKAALSGTVASLIPDRGVIVETTGALIQGVWGNGNIDSGLMNVLAKEASHTLTADQLDVSYRGSVIMAGHVDSAEVIKSAAELPLRGLILSSMLPSLLPVASKVQIPILLLEGFGFQPINPVAFKLLSTNPQRDVVVNAEAWDIYAGTRPEVIIPLPSAGEIILPKDTDYFKPGQKVRVIRAPHLGEIGTVQELREIAAFPSGVRAEAAEVRLENGNVAVLPLRNLDVLE